MAVREAIGAAVPSAGVGCAFSRAALSALADRQSGAPFDPASLTEDYEIGLRIAEMGGTAAFVRMSDGRGDIICTREHFPETFQAAVKQKARWMIGISLSGWDRLGWHGGVAERWMRLRDRRAALAALILLAAYICLPLWGLIVAVQMLTGQSIARMSPILEALIGFNAALMTWRLLIRALFVSAAYGWRQGLLSVPRTFMANLIAIFAARRALGMYVGLLRGAPLIWDKTRHRFPAADTAEA
jgi:adsorption protein B